jgi:hypothetical protein
MATLTENGAAAEQRAGVGEKFKFRKLWPIRRMRWARRAPVSVRAPSRWLGRSGEAVDATVTVELGLAAMAAEGRLCLFLSEEEKGRGGVVEPLKRRRRGGARGRLGAEQRRGSTSGAMVVTSDVSGTQIKIISK